MIYIFIKVADSVWTESGNSWGILTYKNTVYYEDIFFYSKKYCLYKNNIVIVPLWLYNKLFADRKRPEVIVNQNFETLKEAGDHLLNLNI